MGTRRQYTEAFKREAIRLASAPGNSMASVAKDLGVHRGLERPPGKRTWTPV